MNCNSKIKDHPNTFIGGVITMLKKQSYLAFFRIFLFLFAFVVLGYTSSYAQNIIVEDSNNIGQLCIRLQDTPNVVFAFTMDLRVDPLVLEFTPLNSSDKSTCTNPEDPCSKGDLGNIFNTFSVNIPSDVDPGVVRISGFGENFVPVGSLGTLVCLDYDVLDPTGTSSFCLERFTGEILETAATEPDSNGVMVQAWTHSCGNFTVTQSDDDFDGYYCEDGWCADGSFSDTGCEADKDCDCGDTDVNPGETEVCDGKDNNCDGQIDEGCPIFVDDDCINTPGTGTVGDPFCKIKDGINAAGDGDEVLVAGGNYVENLSFGGTKTISVRSNEGAVIDGSSAINTATVIFMGGDSSLLEGFVITGGSLSGISCTSSSPTITNCTVVGNSLQFGVGGGIGCNSGSNPTITNCTIADNMVTLFGTGGGIGCNGSSSPTVINSILWGNSAVGSPNQIGLIDAPSSSIVIDYSDIEGGWPTGTGNIGALPAHNPLFVGGGNYHLTGGSPCKDAGTSNSTTYPTLPPDDIIYIGKLSYKGVIYEGEHGAIVQEEIWRQVQNLLRRNGNNGGKTLRNKYGALLRGLLYCIPCNAAMSHSYTVKNKNKRYRYYVCCKAQKQGWDSCPTKSLPAAEIEQFVVDRIRGIGADSELVAETIDQASSQNRKRLDDLGRERQILEREIKRYNTDIRQLISSGDQNTDSESPTTVRLADLQDRIRIAEQRATSIREEIIAVNREMINEQELATALSRFDPMWESLSSREQARMIHLLVERIGYDGEKSTVALTFHPTGIKALAQEMNFSEQEG